MKWEATRREKRVYYWCEGSDDGNKKRDIIFPNEDLALMFEVFLSSHGIPCYEDPLKVFWGRGMYMSLHFLSGKGGENIPYIFDKMENSLFFRGGMVKLEEKDGSIFVQKIGR